MLKTYHDPRFQRVIAGPKPCLSVLSQTRDRRLVRFAMTSQVRGAIA